MENKDYFNDMNLEKLTDELQKDIPIANKKSTNKQWEEYLHKHQELIPYDQEVVNQFRSSPMTKESKETFSYLKDKTTNKNNENNLAKLEIEMAELISDYVTEKLVSPEQFKVSIFKALDEEIKYHSKILNLVTELKTIMLG
jgi:hypothetical protein